MSSGKSIRSLAIFICYRSISIGYGKKNPLRSTLTYLVLDSKLFSPDELGEATLLVPAPPPPLLPNTFLGAFAATAEIQNGIIARVFRIEEVINRLAHYLQKYHNWCFNFSCKCKLIRFSPDLDLDLQTRRQRYQQCTSISFSIFRLQR